MDIGARVQAVLDDLVARDVERGLQVAVYLDGRLIVDAWAGLADATTGRKVDGDTLFCLWSTTKGITATVIHRLVERGLLEYDAPLARYWPEFAAHGKQALTLRHVLAHTAGLPQLPEGVGPRQVFDWDWMVRELAALSPLWEPGTVGYYHSLTYGWLLGEVARRVTGLGFGELVQREVCAPLGIDSLYLGVPDTVEARLARLEGTAPAVTPPSDDLVWRAVSPPLWPLHDWANRADFQHAVLPAAGGQANARAIARHYAALIGQVDGVRLLPPQRLALAIERQPELPQPSGAPLRNRALGYELYGAPADAGRMAPFGHSGAGGTVGYADPTRRLAYALTKNRMVNNGKPGEDAGSIVGSEIRAALGIS